jgi:hypothetical protein
MGGKIPWAQGHWGPAGDPSLGTYNIKKYFSAKYNYLNNLFMFSLFNGNL